MDVENTSQCFEVRSKIHNTHQGSMTITKYYNTLMELWQEMDLFYEIEWSYQIDARKYKKFVNN